MKLIMENWRKSQQQPEDPVEHANALLYEGLEAIEDLRSAVTEDGYEFRWDASVNLADLIYKSDQIVRILKELQKQRLV